ETDAADDRHENDRCGDEHEPDAPAPALPEHALALAREVEGHEAFELAPIGHAGFYSPPARIPASRSRSAISIRRSLWACSTDCRRPTKRRRATEARSPMSVTMTSWASGSSAATAPRRSAPAGNVTLTSATGRSFRIVAFLTVPETSLSF